MTVAAAAAAAAAEMQLPAADAWVSEVLQRCTEVHYTPQRELLRVSAPVAASDETPAPSSAAAVSSRLHHSAPTACSVVVDVDAEEDVDVESPTAAVSAGSYQPYLPPVRRTASTAEAEGVRAALPAPLLRKAYRVQLPCVTEHATKGERLLNCAASPRCMSGLRTLAGDAATREDCLKVAMGEGPSVVAVTEQPHSARGASKMADEVKAGAMAARRVAADPSFPCLWRGVQNLMNTCYFSSVLQMVFSVTGLRRAILKDSAPTAIASAAGKAGTSTATATAPAVPVSTQLEESGLRELFALMAFSREGAGADPKSFASYLSLDVKVQQDAQEFFTLLLDWLRCHCGPAVQAAVTSAFAGTLLYDRRCGVCGRSAKRAEPFLHLSLPVRPTLEDSLSEFSKPEEVDGFMCEGCGQTAVATSRQYMRTLPDALVVHWNRFEFDLHTLQRHKVTTATSFPLLLDMTPYTRQWHAQKKSTTAAAATAAAAATTTTAGEPVKEEPVEEEQRYELRGIVNHHGDTALSGHYTYHGKVSSELSADDTSRSGSTWLSFNDGEVTPLSRYQGQRGVSAEAYLLVYHRVSSSPTAAVSTAAATTASTAGAAAAPTATWSPPSPAEFPLYLRQYVDQVNQRCLDERAAWLEQRAQVASLFDLWATTAHAVFDTPVFDSFSSTSGGTGGVASASAPTTYAVPTAWLQQLGRLFLPAYVDVTSLGGGKESELKRKKKELANLTGGSGGGGQEGPGAAGDSGSGRHDSSAAGSQGDAQGDASTATPTAEKAAVDGVVVSSAGGPRRHGLIQSVEEVHQLVRQHSFLQALPSLSCPHGALAPWSPYKLISASAYARLSHFLRVCGAPLTVSGSSDSAAAADAQSSCAFVESNLCPPCVAAMAAAVKDLAVTAAEDDAAEAALTSAWREAERRRDAEERCASAGGSASVHQDCSVPGADANEDDEEGESREGGLVLVSKTLVEGWASYYVSQQAWGRVQEAEGYTAVLVMREARLPPPRTPSAPCQGSSGSSAASPPLPTTPAGSARSSHTISHTLADAEEAIGIAALSVDRGDLDLSAQLLCPHGTLRPGQHVVAVPASLRRYWVRRFTEVLTFAHRAGQLRIADATWRVTEEDVDHFMLPYIPASTTSTTCRECMRASVQTLTSRHHERLRKMEERRKFPSLWLAGAMTSPAGVAQLLLATGAENEEQLLAAQHPNRLFYKHNAERDYRDYVKRWSEAQQARIAHQESEVARLQMTVAKKKEHDAAWNARVTTRRGGRGGSGGGSATGNARGANSPVTPASSTAAPDPETLEGRLFYAEAALAALRVQPVPDHEVSYGCVPTWWVARWYAAMQEDASRVTAATPSNAERQRDGGEGEDGADVKLPPITFRIFKCEHGGCLLEVPWLNPTDGFWQGARGRRAEVLWNGVRVERATSARADKTAAAPDAEGPGQAEYRSACWLPPLTILPMEEYVALLAQYGTPQMLAKAMGAATADEAPGPQLVTDVDAPETVPAAAPDAAPPSPLSPVAEAVIQLVAHNGTRQLQPAPCPGCCAKLLATFEANGETFVNGSLKLNFHIKKSRKNFYDASSVLTSAAVQQGRQAAETSSSSVAPAKEGEETAAAGGHAAAAITVDDDGVAGVEPPRGLPAAPAAATGRGESIPDGVHYYTTLAQLRRYIHSHLRERHGYLVQPEDLQITRGRNKPLKLRSPVPQEASEEAGLENATLHELGIRDGDTLMVQSLDAIAQACATGPGVEEEWEAIPPELLQGGSDGRSSRTATTAKEHAAAFRETRLQGSYGSTSNTTAAAGAGGIGTSAPSSAGAVVGAVVSGAPAVPQEDQPVSCAVCTFLNAPGMVVCEMCEAPLPTR